MFKVNLLTSRHEEGNSESAIQHTGSQTLQSTAIEWQSATHQHIKDHAQTLKMTNPYKIKRGSKVMKENAIYHGASVIVLH